MAKSRRRTEPVTEATDLRIIGGKFRGRKLRYEPFRMGDDPVTRPMKHRVREAIFNLVGMEAAGRRAIDLFAGTGALGLEALSRGAAAVTLIEKHVPTARVIEDNIRALGVEAEATLLATSAFLWGKRDAQLVAASDGMPWVVFCSPPYAFYVEREEEMMELIENIVAAAPSGSVVVVEADERFDFGVLPAPDQWDVRTYAPAVVGVWRKA